MGPSITVLAENLNSVCGLIHLELSETQMNEEGAAALSNGLRSLTELEVLDISHSPLGSAVTVIAAHLQSTPCLTELNMNKTEMGWDEAAPVASSLKFLQNLRMLSIGSNPFERGVHVLVQHLCKIPKLKRLDLTSVVMGDEEANLVSNAFKKIRTLTITTDYLVSMSILLCSFIPSSYLERFSIEMMSLLPIRDSLTGSPRLYSHFPADIS